MDVQRTHARSNHIRQCDQDGLCSLDVGVIDHRDRNRFDQFSRHKGQRAGGQREICAARGGAAGYGVIDRHIRGCWRAQRDLQNRRTTRLRDAARAGGKTRKGQGRNRVIVFNGVSESGVCSELRSVRVAQQKGDHFIRFDDVVVGDGERDVLGLVTHAEGQGAGGQGVIDGGPIGRGHSGGAREEFRRRICHHSAIEGPAAVAGHITQHHPGL